MKINMIKSLTIGFLLHACIANTSGLSDEQKKNIGLITIVAGVSYFCLKFMHKKTEEFFNKARTTQTKQKMNEENKRLSQEIEEKLNKNLENKNALIKNVGETIEMYKDISDRVDSAIETQNDSAHILHQELVQIGNIEKENTKLLKNCGDSLKSMKKLLNDLYNEENN